MSYTTKEREDNYAGKKKITGRKTTNRQAYETKRYTAARVKHFKSFRHDRRRFICNDWDEVSSLWIACRRCATGHGLAGHTYFESLLSDVHYRSLETPNLKEEVAAQLTSFKTIGSNMLQIMHELGAQLNIRRFLENPTYSDVQALDLSGATPRVVLWTTDTLNTLIGILEDEKVPVPNIILPFLDFTCKTAIKLQDEYTIEEDQIPPAYFIPSVSDQVYADVRDNFWCNASDGVDGNQGKAKLHMDKFGIKYTPFSRKMIEPNPPVEVMSDLGISILTQIPITTADGGAAYTIHNTNAADFSTAATDFTNRQYMWKGKAPANPTYPIANLLYGEYDATYNVYGSIFKNEAPRDSQGYFNILRWSRTGQTPAHLELETSPEVFEKSIIPLLGCFYGIHGTGKAVLAMQMHGTTLTDHVDLDLALENHPFMTMPDMWVNTVGTGPSYKLMKKFNLNYLGERL